jgi:hypothetical protein
MAMLLLLLLWRLLDSQVEWLIVMGLRLGLWTATTSRHSVHPADEVSSESDVGMIYWQEKPVPVPLCPPQIPRGLTRARTRDSAVRGPRLTAWAIALSSDRYTSVSEKYWLHIEPWRCRQYISSKRWSLQVHTTLQPEEQRDHLCCGENLKSYFTNSSLLSYDWYTKPRGFGTCFQLRKAI